MLQGASAGMIAALATCGTLAVGFLMVDKPESVFETSIEVILLNDEKVNTNNHSFILLFRDAPTTHSPYG